MDTLGLAARPALFAGAARSLTSGGAVWLSHGLDAAIQRSAQLHPQLGQPGSMNVGGCDSVGVTLPRPDEDEEEGLLFLHCNRDSTSRVSSAEDMNTSSHSAIDNGDPMATW
jgi:hypothetical protein